jgi:serine kinase of HPr protein (carbohydrate metabolism regulator)
MSPCLTKGQPSIDAGQSHRQGQNQDHVHASAVAIKEAGVLIRGRSGAGKSSLALALIAAAENAGFFARLIGDDRIYLESHGGRLIARGHPLILGRIERRGKGILEIPFLTAAVVRLVIDLDPPDQLGPRYPEPDCDRVRLFGVSLPFIRLGQDSAASDLALTVLQLFHLRSKSSRI